MALQDLIADVGCCVSSVGYQALNDRSNNCGIAIPKLCPHLFKTSSSEACQTFGNDYNVFLDGFAEEECCNAIRPLIASGVFGDIYNVSALNMAEQRCAFMHVSP